MDKLQQNRFLSQFWSLGRYVVPSVNCWQEKRTKETKLISIACVRHRVLFDRVSQNQSDKPGTKIDIITSQ